MFSTTTIEFSALTTGDKIGEGGFGIVYKGTYHFKPAAIKQLQINNFSPEAEEEFTKEANMMDSLHHPIILHFYGYCSVPKCLVMEYMPKGSLFNVLHDKKQPLDWNIRIRIAIDIASGLAFLHSRDILHRDIKSLNVLLDAQMDAKLTDFGLSKVKNETKSKTTATRTHQDTVGTVQWMAPELFKRKAVFTQKADIYGLGITFWELASRKIPYGEDTQAAIPAFVQQGDREDIPSDCPEKLAYLIQQCWANDPNTRPSASDIARFMTTDAKTLQEVQASSKSMVVESAGYQQISQISPAFALYQKSPQSVSEPTPVKNPAVTPPVSPVHVPDDLAMPHFTPKRRGTQILHLGDKKEEQEKMRYVLEALRNLFLEERDDGEKTENYSVYNEYLKKAHSEALLVYKERQKKHVLIVNNKHLDNDVAATEISQMLKSLATANVPEKPLVQAAPQAVALAAVPALKANAPDEKTALEPAMLSQFENFIKPAPQVNASSLTAFLKFVAEGEQDIAEAMLQANPALALVSGDVTDLSSRTFTNITGFQYAVWALDWHMWTMIRKYLPDNEAKQQAEGFETGAWVKNHSVDARWILDKLLQAYETTIALYKKADDAIFDYKDKKRNEANMAWVQQVGGAQLLLPAHVINEYCDPTRSFWSPNLKDGAVLSRSRVVGQGEWFTAVFNGGKLGKGWACLRAHWPAARECWQMISGRGFIGISASAVLDVDGVPVGQTCSGCDRDGVRALTSTRTAQRDELINELKPRNAQRKTA